MTWAGHTFMSIPLSRNRNESAVLMAYISGDFSTNPREHLLVHIFKELKEQKTKSVA